MRGSPGLLTSGDVGVNCSKALPPSLLPSIRTFRRCKPDSNPKPALRERLSALLAAN